MKKFYKLLIAFVLIGSFAKAQVTVSGGSTATYSNVNAAFAAINAGTHFGAITISVTASTNEGVTGYLPTPLLASGQGPANYTSIVLRPTATATISGDVATGRGVLELDGVDNFTFDGDIVGGPVQRDLSIVCTSSMNVAATAAIRFIGRTTLGLGATNNIVKNCIIVGNTPGNDGISGSTIANSYGIYAGANAVALTSGGLGENYDNLTITNNEFNRAYFGLYIGSSTTNVGNDNLINNNLFGSNTVGSTLSNRGLMLTNVVTNTVTQNEFFNLKVNTSVSNAGIEISGASSNSVTISRNKVYSIWSTSTGGWGAYGISLIGGNNHLLTNNVIYDILTTNYNSLSTTFQAFGIRITSGTGHKIYYNSVNLFGALTAGSATNCYSASFMVSSTTVTGLDIRNNVFCNKMTSNASTPRFYAVWFPASYNFLNATLNNNAYMVTNDADHFVGKIGTTALTNDLANLAAWQAFSQVNNASNDNASVPFLNTVAPFISDVNLNFNANTITPIESGAVLIPALGTNIDYNANVRPLAGINPNTNPDMGAYEFDGLAGVATDAGIIALINPLTTGCYSAAENVVVTIKNYGTSSISNIPVSLVVSGVINQTLTGTYTGTIAPSGTFNFSLGTINMIAAGVYSFNATTSLPGDLNTPNDAMSATNRTVIAPSPLPQSVDFTSFTGANLPTFFPLWREATGATAPTGTTSSWTSQTALNNATNVNARVFLSAIAANEWIVGPKITATSTTQISFDAALTLNTTAPFTPTTMGSDDKLRVMVSTDCGVTFVPIFTVNTTNNLGTNFTNFTVPLGAYAGQDIIVAFLAQDGPVDDLEAYYLHLDNINLYNASATDGGVSAINSPTLNACLGTNEPVVVTVTNFGTAAISNFSVTATVNGPVNTTITATYTAALAASASAVFTVGTVYMNIPGSYTITAFTSVGGDPNAFNNSSSVIRTLSPAFNISGNTLVCLSSTGTLSLVGGAVSYTWSTGSNSQSITITPSVTTTYSAIGTGTNGCQVSAFATVTINNPTITAGGAAVCGTTAVGTLTANGFAPVTWYATSTPTNPLATGNTFTASAATTTTYYAQANSTATGSIATTYTAGNGSNGNMFDVTALNAITINSVDVMISSVVVTTVEVWYRPGSFVGFESANTGWISAGTGTVMGAGNGNPVPFGVNLGINIPAGQTYGIYVTANGGGSFGYSNGTAVGNLFTQNSDISIFEGKGGSYFAVTIATRVWNGNIYYTKQGCSSPIIPVTLTVTSSPTITLGASQLSVCPGTSVNIGATGATTYTWSTGANGALISVTPTASTIYTISGETSPGCLGTASIAITSNTVPSVGVASSASLICVGQTASLTASGANNYLWNTSSTNSVIAVSPTVTTSYTVTGTAANSCTNIATFTQNVSNCTGVEANSTFSSLISIYPNPSSGVITADFNFEGEKDVVITNSVGQVITTLKTKNTSEVIDLNKYAKGIYFVKVISNTNSANYRIVIQ
ncbi:MAG: T9SS type A sorting domain-containing protein [Bacteroidia bacterium]|nr:T9SS type A sorting domain-containing protein [Bacteroidia bacterium]